MERKEAKEIVNVMNRHLSTKEVHLEVIGTLSCLMIALSSDSMGEFIAEECAQALVGVQRLIELHNCADEVKIASERILEHYKGCSHER